MTREEFIAERDRMVAVSGYTPKSAEYELLTRNGWLSMDSAPTDGTWILGRNDAGNKAVIIRSTSAMRRRSYVGPPESQWEIGEGWIMPFTMGEVSSFWEDARVKFWMPLPF